ncbi:PTS mannitol transporter subunit IICBA, partial [Mammaliicoccus fleurettii]
ATSYGAGIIHFLGGIHEIYFPYVLMRPLLLVAVILGGMTGVATFSIFDFGTTGPASPGSILAYFAITPKGSYLVMLLGIFLATLVSFLVASIILKVTKDPESDLESATADMEARKGKKSSVSGALTGADKEDKETSDDAEEKDESDGLLDEYDTENVDAHDFSNVQKVIFACDAGMGSSAMGAGMLRNKFKKAELTNIEVTNTAINQLPDDADVVITQKTLTDRAIKKNPKAIHISVDNFLNSPRYEELISELKK